MRYSRTGFMPKTVTTETAVKNEIKRWLAIFGWRCWHNLQGLGSYKGMPDITAIKKGVIIWIEAKAPKGIQSPHQIAFQDMIESNGGHYILAKSSKDVEDFILHFIENGKTRLL